MLSALTGDGVADLKSYLAVAVPPGPWLFPEDQLTDASLRQTAAEITREKLFLRLHEELPYQLTVETTEWKELKDKSVRIEQTIYVTRESQRKIVLGAKGQTIKEIGTRRTQPTSPRWRACRCISSCSSRCASDGARIPSATARWASTTRRSERSREKASFDRGTLAYRLTLTPQAKHQGGQRHESHSVRDHCGCGAVRGEPLFRLLSLSPAALEPRRRLPSRASVQAPACRAPVRPSQAIGAQPGAPGSPSYDPNAALPSLGNQGSAVAPEPGTSASGNHHAELEQWTGHQ